MKKDTKETNENSLEKKENVKGQTEKTNRNDNNNVEEKKKMKLWKKVLIVIVILLLIFIAIVLRKFIILADIDGKVSEYENNNSNIYSKIISTNSEYTMQTECYIKDNIIKYVFEKTDKMEKKIN